MPPVHVVRNTAVHVIGAVYGVPSSTCLQRICTDRRSSICLPPHFPVTICRVENSFADVECVVCDDLVAASVSTTAGSSRNVELPGPAECRAMHLQHSRCKHDVIAGAYD